jgi:hypothetical protein
MDNDSRMMNILMGAGVVFAVGWFFVASALVMVIWNNVIIKSFAPGFIQKIDYITAMGMTFFFSIVSGPSYSLVVR